MMLIVPRKMQPESLFNLTSSINVQPEMVHEIFPNTNTVIRLKHVEYQLVMRISGFVLRCGFRNQFSQRHLLKHVDAQNLQNLGQTQLQSKFLAHDGHQHVNADGNPDLRLDSIVARAEKVLDPQILFDPLEEQLYPPAALIELRDRQSGQVEVIRQEDKGLAALRVSITDAAEAIRVVLNALAQAKPDYLVAP